MTSRDAFYELVYALQSNQRLFNAMPTLLLFIIQEYSLSLCDASKRAGKESNTKSSSFNLINAEVKHLSSVHRVSKRLNVIQRVCALNFLSHPVQVKSQRVQTFTYQWKGE